MSKLRTISKGVGALLRHPRKSLRQLAGAPELVRGNTLARQWQPGTANPAQTSKEAPANPLRAYFDALHEGHGVWKWLHYFELYHRHLQKFAGRELTLVEVGVYSGGSMPMWRHYLGAGCTVHGIDIMEECRVYADAHTTIHIGDQADRAFWKQFHAKVPSIDVLIDDGGHEPEQQMVTLEEVLPHIKPGGVYICEDVHGVSNKFSAFVHAFTDHLNAFAPEPGKELVSPSTALQAAVNSVHFYPFVVVIEMRDAPMPTLTAPKHGTMWQPFL